MATRPVRIVLTGFSGSGKSAVARIVGERLGWRAVDTDALVEKAAGRSVADVFARDGEAAFRDLESGALREACAAGEVVIAAGGGALLRPANRRLAADGAFIVCLEARPETILQRLREAGSDVSERPLLAGGNPLARIRELKAGRQAGYALADCTVHTDDLAPEAVADEVVRAWEERSEAALADPTRLEAIAECGDGGFEGAACVVRTASGAHPVYVEWGALESLGRRLREAGLAGRAYVISDETVLAEYGARVDAALSEADVPFTSYAFPPGEASKSLATAEAVYDWLIERRAERGHTIVALGGGTVTDLAGYVAATYLRGLSLVHVPTSLLGMVDAAIGGKVAVNHPRAKNAVGAFYQPRLVLADVSTLSTLPPRELSGWAEAIKHALILDAALLDTLEEKAEALLALEPEPTTKVIRRSVSIKADVVSEDERETTGRRTLLNYGHTLGHAVEAVTGYERFRHGEADAIGMTAAAAISRRLGLLSAGEEARQRAVLERFGLPTTAEGLDREAVKASMALDKKVRAGAIRWVLLQGIGHAVLRDDVPADVVDAALAEALP